MMATVPRDIRTAHVAIDHHQIGVERRDSRENMAPPPESPNGSQTMSFDKLRLPGSNVDMAETSTTKAPQNRRLQTFNRQ